MPEFTKLQGNIAHLANTIDYFQEFKNNLINFNKNLTDVLDAVAKAPVQLDDATYQKYFNQANNNIRSLHP